MSEETVITQRNRVRAAQKNVADLEAAQQVHDESAARIEAELRSIGIDPSGDLDEQLATLEAQAEELLTNIESNLKKLEPAHG